MRRAGIIVPIFALLILATSCSSGDSNTTQVHPAADCPPTCPKSTGPRLLGRQPAPNPIPAENQKPGDPTWESGGTAKEGELDVYATTDTAQAGQTVSARVNADPPVTITTKVYRLGYYGGAGARLVWQGPDVHASTQPRCPMDLSTGLLTCPWSNTFSFTVGEDWVSGLYLVKVQRADGIMRFAPFVVRDHRAAEVLFVSGSDTSEAYNRWGNVSLYWDGTGKLKKGRAYAVSYDRPYRETNGAGQMLRWEYWLARWLEENGYDVTYGTDVEFVRYDDELQGIGMAIHAGHDEYWPVPEREQIDAWVQKTKMSLAYFGANPCYWRVRLEPDGSAPYRNIVCYKDMVSLDPQPNSTIRYRDPPDALPENALYGAGYKSYIAVQYPLAVTNPGSWVLAGTGLTQGMLLPGLVGPEFDQPFGDANDPKNQEVVMASPVVTATGSPDVAEMVDHTMPNGNIVFDAASIGFPVALSDDPAVHDDRIGRMVLNIVDRGIRFRDPQLTPPVPGPHVPKPPAPVGVWAKSVTAFAGTVGARGLVDGPGAGAKFDGPTGLAAFPDGRVVVADTNNCAIRLIGNDAAHTVSTVAGDGLPGNTDGPGNQARFRQPTGVAVGPDGAIYVADTLNDDIRRIAFAGGGWTATTFAGAARETGTADGTASDARFDLPSALAFDAAGNLYVADSGNNEIRRIDATSHDVETLAGTPGGGDSDGDPGTRAAFVQPTAIAVAGTAAYFVDTGNQRLRRMDLGGTHAVTTIAGTAPVAAGFADGTGDQAMFRMQLGLDADASGDLVLADTANYRLRLVTPGATAATTEVVTLAGSGNLGSALGTGDQADLVAPAGVAVRPDGTIAVSDSYNEVVRLVTR